MNQSNDWLADTCNPLDTVEHLVYQLPKIEFINKRKCQYANIASVFDIEASSFYDENNEKRCTMYAWVFGIDGKCIIGRTWNEFLYAIEIIKKSLNLSLKRRLIVYVHNLSYEFQWFRKYFDWETVFSLDTRKPIYAVTKDGIEFRCSYLLSGYSLVKLGDNLTKYKVSKKVGDLDYSLIRHSQTPLNNKEIGYIINDGLVVMAHIKEEIERLGDITKLPITNTGYVRNLCRQKCLMGDNKFDYGKQIRTLTLDKNTYSLLKQTYSGGFTHANLKYVDETLKNIHSFDFTSSYPAITVSEKFPMSKPHKVIIKKPETFERALRDFCCMFRCKFYNLRQRFDNESYISLSKAISIENYILNNGRIIECDYVEVAITEQDFFIISKIYEYDKIELSDFYVFYKEYLPRDFILSILELYKDKTELKGVEGKEVEYLVSKGMINSCYGMCVTDPCRDFITYNNNIWDLDKVDIESALEKYNKDTQRFLYYAWGVWITAYARRNLFTGILEFDDDYVYSDTDSLKVKNVENHMNYIDEYNKNVIKKTNNCLKYRNIPISMASPKTKNGEIKQIGVWDYEGKYDRFKTLGAKRYLTETNGKLSLTVAGVNKKSGIEYLTHMYKTNDKIFEEFKEGLYFPPHYDKDGIDENGSGKLCHTYIDFAMNGEIIDYLGNKNTYSELSGVHMENTDYTIGLEYEFKKLIEGMKLGHII